MGTISALGPRPINPLQQSRVLARVRMALSAMAHRLHRGQQQHSLDQVSTDVLRDIGFDHRAVQQGMPYSTWRP